MKKQSKAMKSNVKKAGKKPAMNGTFIQSLVDKDLERIEAGNTVSCGGPIGSC